MCKTIFRFIGIVSIFAIILVNFFDVQAQEFRARMLIPLYMYPSENVWANVVNANINKNIDVIINPSNGSGTSQKVAFINGVNQLRAGYVGVFGYVITNYGSRSLSTVKNEIDNYYEWYHVDGIFLDEASNSISDISYYSDLWLYINAKGMKVILNPGANTKEDYAAISNSIVIYESVVPKDLSVSAWVGNYPSSKFAALQYGASAEQMRNFVALAKKNNIGYIYVTNDTGSNPWDELPPYLAEEATLLWGMPAISGNIGVSGVVLSYLDGTFKTVLTQPDGSYTLDVPNGWSGTVTPTHSCYTFTPSSRNYSNLSTVQINQNYTPTFTAVNGCVNTSVEISAVNQGSYGMVPGSSLRKSYTGIDDGPVNVNGNGNNIIAAERVIYNPGGIPVSFTEMMGLPSTLVDDEYWFPWYNNVNVDTQLRFGNVSGLPASVRVIIGGTEMPGSPFTLTATGAGQSLRVSFAGVNDGPVRIISNQPIVAAERIIYSPTGSPTSFSEMMGLPASQVNTTFVFPWYNNIYLDTQLRFANVSSSTATVNVYIGGTLMPGSPFTLPASGAGRSKLISFSGIDNGPVRIVSDQPIVASERTIYNPGTGNTSFTEMMGLPLNQVDTTYYFPWYNNLYLDTQLRFGNVSGVPASVHVYIGGVEVTGSPFALTASGTGQSLRISFAGIDNGPVRIVSDQPIVAAEREIYLYGGIPVSFTEMMGLPSSLLTPSYWFPWYNNLYLDTQLRFGAP